MACACKKRKAAGQVTAVKQVAKQAIVSSHSNGIVESSPKTTSSVSTATTVKRNVVKRIMFKRH